MISDHLKNQNALYILSNKRLGKEKIPSAFVLERERERERGTSILKIEREPDLFKLFLPGGTAD